MPTAPISALTRRLSEFTDAAISGVLAPDRATSAGNQTPAAGFLYHAVLSVDTASEFGASTKYTGLPGDGPADGDVIPANIVIPIGAHTMVDLDVVGTLVYLYLMPKP